MESGDSYTITHTLTWVIETSMRLSNSHFELNIQSAFHLFQSTTNSLLKNLISKKYFETGEVFETEMGSARK